jgi:hypothetical protein
MQWISLKDKLPELSYLEEVGADYTCLPVLVFSKEAPGSCCVACLCKNYDEDDLNLRDLSWNIYIPGEHGDWILDIDLEEFTHWMPLPGPPTITEPSPGEKILQEFNDRYR